MAAEVDDDMSWRMNMQFCGQDFPMDTEEIDCVNESIHSLAPLSGMENLRKLRLSFTDPHVSQVHPLSDLSPLRDLRRLEVLEVPESEVSDLGSLKGLKNLTDRKSVV